MSLWAYVYLFYTLTYFPSTMYLLYPSNYSSFGHWGLFQVDSCVSLMCPNHCFSVLCCLSGTIGHLLSFHSFPAPAVKSDISTKSSDFLAWRVVFRNESQDFGHAPCYQPCQYWLALASICASGIYLANYKLMLVIPS